MPPAPPLLPPLLLPPLPGAVGPMALGASIRIDPRSPASLRDASNKGEWTSE